MTTTSNTPPKSLNNTFKSKKKHDPKVKALADSKFPSTIPLHITPETVTLNKQALKQTLDQKIQEATISEVDRQAWPNDRLMAWLTRGSETNPFRPDIKEMVQLMNKEARDCLAIIGIEGIARGIVNYWYNSSVAEACALLEKYQAVLNPYEGSMEVCMEKEKKDLGTERENSSLQFLIYVFLIASIYLYHAYIQMLKAPADPTIKAKLHQQFEAHNTILKTYQDLYLLLNERYAHPFNQELLKQQQRFHAVPSSPSVSTVSSLGTAATSEESDDLSLSSPHIQLPRLNESKQAMQCDITP